MLSLVWRQMSKIKMSVPLVNFANANVPLLDYHTEPNLYDQ